MVLSVGVSGVSVALLLLSFVLRNVLPALYPEGREHMQVQTYRAVSVFDSAPHLVPKALFAVWSLAILYRVEVECSFAHRVFPCVASDAVASDVVSSAVACLSRRSLVFSLRIPSARSHIA